MIFQGPTHVDFNLTNGCNLACAHCHSSSGPKLDNELKLPEILDTIDQLHALGTLSVAFAGGEPFIRRDILDILDHACSLPGWSVSVISNGMFFTAAMLEQLTVRCPTLSINISLDGSTAQMFSILRKQFNRPNADPHPLFTRVVDGIRDVVASGLRNSINFTLTKATLADVVPTYRLAVDELGAMNLVAIKFFPGGYGKEHLEEFEIPYRIWNQAFAELSSLKVKGEIPQMQISVPAPWEFYLPVIEAGIDVEAAEQAWRYRSPLREQTFAAKTSIGDVAGVAELSVSADGDIYPTVLLGGSKGMVVGNVRHQRLADIWAHSEQLRNMRSLRIEDVAGGCAGCSAKGLCGGGSRARAYSITESLTAADYTCPLITEVTCHA